MTTPSFAQIAAQLVRVNVLSDSEIEQLSTEAASANQSLDGPELLRELLECGRVTPFQAAELSAGRGDRLQIGNYLLLNQIGEGGMGTVYQALHKRMRRPVALKMLRSDCATETFVARFHREVEAAGRLNHPHAVSAYDAGECEFGHYFVMELVDGEDLNSRVKREGPLDVPEAISVIRQAALALGYAHRHGIVHRDVKPANLLRDHQGCIKLADLGLAQLRDESAQARLTMDGTSMGTVDFIPPEQALDATSVDHRADIYSLGCTLYFLLAARPLYDRPSLVQRIMAHRTAPIPPLPTARPDVPPALDAIYQKMVAKEPSGRYGSMDEVIAALDSLAPKSSAEEELNFANLMVLLVEPSTFQAVVVQKYLRDLGVDDIHVHRSMRESRASLRLWRPNVVVTSFQLPDGNGIEFSQRLREDLHLNALPIVLMTADPLSREQLRYVESSPVTAALTKPFKSPDLEAVLRQVLAAGRAQPRHIFGLEQLPVLIVDDSSVARRHMERTLRDLGFARFKHAENGQLATEELKRASYALVVTDYNMPEMNGGELVTWIRRDSQQPHVPVVVCTTEHDPAKLAPLYSLGVSAICNKTFDIELVRNVVIRLFK